jgi:hypothetical protein
MNKFAVTVLVAFVMRLVNPGSAQAQGTVFISNLGQAAVGSVAVASNAWVAQSFQTGSFTGGYFLNAIELELGAASGNPGGFRVMLYGPYNNISPGGNFLGNLTGATNPAAGGVFSYAAAGISLLPSSTYWIVMTDQISHSNGAYALSLASFFGYSASDNWSTDRYYETSVNGLSWTDSAVGYDIQFAIDAARVPEPQTINLLLIGAGGLIYVRARNRRAIEVRQPKRARRPAEMML